MEHLDYRGRPFLSEDFPCVCGCFGRPLGSGLLREEKKG